MIPSTTYRERILHVSITLTLFSNNCVVFMINRQWNPISPDFTLNEPITSHFYIVRKELQLLNYDVYMFSRHFQRQKQ
jgi:hypothetical protein